MKADLPVASGLLVGFVAYSLPLLVHDLGLWTPSWSAASGGGADLPGAEAHVDYGHTPSHYEEDEGLSKFRTAVSEGHIERADALRLAGLAESPPVDYINKVWNTAPASSLCAQA